MNKIVIVPNNDELMPQKKSRRGAKVYGMPLSREIVSYIDDAAPQANQQRLIDMFFAGKFSPIQVAHDYDDLDDELEDEDDFFKDGDI